MDNRLSWAGKKSYQPQFELAGAKEKPEPKLRLTGGDVVRKKDSNLLGFEKSLSHLCKEVQDEPQLRKLKPSEIRARRHSEKRYERRFK